MCSGDGRSGRRTRIVCLLVALLAPGCGGPPRTAPAPSRAARAAPDTLSRDGLESLVGTVHQRTGPVTETSDELGGWLLRREDGPPSFTYAIHRTRLRGRVYIALDSAAGLDGSRVVWRILDAAWEPEERGNLVLAHGCTYDDVVDRSLFGLAVREEAEWFRRVVSAWRADTLAGRFVPVPVTGLRCRHEGWGA